MRSALSWFSPFIVVALAAPMARSGCSDQAATSKAQTAEQTTKASDPELVSSVTDPDPAASPRRAP